MGSGAVQPTALSEVNGVREVAGLRDFVDQPGAISGQRVVLHVDFTTTDGKQCVAERVVVPR